MTKYLFGLALGMTVFALQATASLGQPSPVTRRVQSAPARPAILTLRCPATFGVGMRLGSPIAGWTDEMPQGGQLHANLDGARVDTAAGGPYLVCSYKVLNQSAYIMLKRVVGPQYCRARADKTGFDCSNTPNF